MKKVFFLALACLIGEIIEAQEPVAFRYYSLQDGIADWTITALQKDPSGLLWIGTAHGLQRFDGYTFLTFNTNPANPYSISNHFVHSIKLYADSLLVVTYYRDNDLFDLIDYRNLKKKTVRLKQNGVSPREQVLGIRADAAGNVLVLTSKKAGQFNSIALYEYNFGNGRFELINTLPSYFKGEPNDLLMKVIKLKNDEWIIGNNKDQQLILLNRNKILKRFSVKDFQGAALPSSAFSEPINILERDQNGQIWFAFDHIHHLFQYDSGNRIFRAVPGLPTDGDFSLWWQDKLGHVLVAKTEGNRRFPITSNLYCITPKKKVHDFSHFISVSRQIIDVYSDDFFGTLFLGVDTGLKVFKNNQNSVKSYLKKAIREDNFGLVLRGVASDQKGNIFFANESSYWYSLNKKSPEGKFDTIRIIEEKSDTVLKFNCCFDLIHQEPHFLWGIACQGRDKGLLIRYNLDTKKAKIYRYPAKFRAFAVDEQGQFWLSTEYPNGDYKLLIFNPKNAEFRPFSTAEDPAPFKNLFPYYIAKSKDNSFWVTTNKGLYKASVGNTLKENRFESYSKQTNLGTQLIYCVHEDPKGILWLGSSQGLIRFNPKTLEEKYYTEADGLASNIISGIVEDHLGKIWISTHNGLSRLDPASNKFTNFNDLDGFSHSSFTRYSFFRDEDNVLYFGTVNGVNAFRPERLMNRAEVPELTLTRISKYNWVKDSLLTYNHDLGRIHQINVAAEEHNLELEFTLPIYWGMTKTNYRYKLKGLEDYWVDLKTSNQLTFRQLPTGNYTLLLQGADPRGNWSKSLVLKIHVATFFYNTWWFWTLCAGILMGLSYFLVRFRLIQKLKIEKLRTKISTDIHDEVSGLLAGIAMQVDVLQGLGKAGYDESRLKKIAEIARKAMTRFHDAIWSIDSNKDYLSDLLLRMQEHADDVLMPLNIAFKVQINHLASDTAIPFQIRQDLYYIFKEAINNVAKHAQADLVLVTLSNQPDYFELIIADNGSSSTQEKPGKGHGKQNMEHRAKRIGATIHFVQDKGFRVSLRMKHLK